MSKNYAFSGTKREQAGKGVARSLRREGNIPAVVYGDSKAPVKISLNARTANLEYRKGHMFTTLCDLEVDGQKHLVLARDVQLHPVTDNVEHIDFLRVNATTKIAVDIPVEFINHENSPGIAAKGVLNVVRHAVELFCIAINIPELIEVDLSKVEIGDTVRINDVKLPEGTSPVIKGRNFVIASMVAPKTAEQIAAEEAAEAAQDAAAAAAAAAGPAAAEGDDKAAAAPAEGDKAKAAAAPAEGDKAKAK